MPPVDFSTIPATFWHRPYAATCFLTFLLALPLGAFVLFKNPRSSAVRMWAVMCFWVASWALWNTFSLLSSTAEESLKYLRIADGFALFIPISFLHFAMNFIGQVKPWPLKAGYAVTGLLALTTGTPWFVSAGQMKFGVIWFEVAGPGFFLFAVLFVLLPSYGLFLLYQEARKSQGVRRAQLLSLILACGLGFGGGFMWFPPAFGIDIPPLGGHLVALYCVIVAYAIVRYQLLDIRVVIQRSLVYSTLITLLTAGYFGLVYAIERICQTTFGYHSLWISLAAFALMTLAFQPLKLWIQRGVDWLVFRVPQEEMVRRMERLEEQAFQAEKFKAVSTLAAGMAHEIKNPLTALKTFTEFIPEKYGDPAFAKKLHEVFTSEIQRIHSTVQDLLNFAKPKPPQLKPVEIVPLISSTVNFLSADLTKHRIECRINCSHDLPANGASAGLQPADGSVAGGAIVQADADQIRQVLINLIQNAADAMPEGGTITLSTKAANGHLELAISDTGQGIPPELLPKIFDPFITTKPTGNGLGLAMVYAIVQAHHGTIRAESTVGRGTTFTLRLPR